MTNRLILHLSGPFRVTGPDGCDFSPKGAKERGLLLLLICQPAHLRARVWLQDKLWSDRGREQGAASLRQALAQVRRAFGPYADILVSNRIEVRLDADRITTVDDGSGEFAEGLDVRDQEFEHWIARERSARSNAVPRPQHLSPQQNGTTSAQDEPDAISISSAVGDWMSELIGDALVLSLREYFSKNVLHNGSNSGRSDAWNIAVDTFAPANKQIGVRLVLHNHLGGQVWSGHRIVDTSGAPPVEHPAIIQLVNEAIETIGDVVVGHTGIDFATSTDADALCRRGIRMIFTMEPDKVRKADQYFEAAYRISGRGLTLAWQAQLRTIQRIERHRTDIETLADESEALAARALELEPKNSMVLAMLANSRLFLQADPEGSLELSSRSTAINPSNPMAWWALSSSQLYCGRTKSAYETAVRARHLARLSEHRFWWDLQQFASAMCVGKLDEATGLLERASAQCPTFRPPFRYLVALYANSGKDVRAMKAAEHLKSLESDFSIDRLLNDRSYPASLLYQTEALNLDRIAALDFD